MARLPRYLPKDDIERIIAACDHQDGTALRNRALLLLLARADTCWYLHATPQLMRGVADACERFLEGGAR